MKAVKACIERKLESDWDEEDYKIIRKENARFNVIKWQMGPPLWEKLGYTFTSKA